MANIITELTARIEDYRSTNKNPCKNYATQAAATYFDKQNREDAPSADYVVFYVEAWVAGWAALTCPSSCAAATRRADTSASARTSSPTNRPRRRTASAVPLWSSGEHHERIRSHSARP